MEGVRFTENNNAIHSSHELDLSIQRLTKNYFAVHNSWNINNCFTINGSQKYHLQVVIHNQ